MHTVGGGVEVLLAAAERIHNARESLENNRYSSSSPSSSVLLGKLTTPLLACPSLTLSFRIYIHLLGILHISTYAVLYMHS